MATTQQLPAVRPQAPAAFGSRDEIQAIADRIRVMLPSARLSESQLKRPDAEIERLQRKLDDTIYRAAQLCVFYRLVPGEDVHVIPFGDEWVVDMGIETWMKAADRYCSLHGVTYHIQIVEMGDEELQRRRGGNYSQQDCGMVAYLWRSDKKDVYEIFGAKQSMTRATGIWRQKGQGGYPDTIQAHRSKEDVAERRARKHILRKEFSLDALLAATPNEVRGSIAVMDSRLQSEERRREIPDTRRAEIDENGFIISDPHDAKRPRRDVKFVVVDEDGVIEEEPDIDDMPEFSGDEVQDDATDYGELAAHLEGTQASFVRWARQTHINSDGPCSMAQYRYLVGVLNGITGVNESHRVLLGVMLTRHVDSSNRPGFDLVDKLLSWLVAEHKDEVTGERIANPAYRQDYVDCVKAIYGTVAA